MDAVRALRDDGVDAIYGDATRPEILEAAGVARAGSLILGSAGMANSADVIRAGRALNPRIRVLARAPYLRDVAALKKAGATSVYSGEGEVALAFIDDILDSLGATPEQIDRERARAHFELVRGRVANGCREHEFRRSGESTVGPRSFQREQIRLHIQATGEPRELACESNHSMARRNDRHRVSAVCRADGAYRSGGCQSASRSAP